MNIRQKQQSIIETFALFGDWNEKYEYVIELGKKLPALAPEHTTDSNLIEGCQSKVWLHASFDRGIVHFEADSDAIITRGLVALMIQVFSGQSPQEILQADTSFINDIGLTEHLSPTRANGLLAMIKQMKLYAMAFSVKIG